LLLHTIELKAESIKPKSTIPSTLSSRDIGQAADSLVQTKQDSLKNDSNYLPRTSAALKSLVSYACKDSIVYHTSTKTSTLFGESDVNYEDLSIKSYQIAININKNTVHAIGVKDSTDKLTQTPVFKQGGSEYKVEEATFNYETKRGIMKEFKTNEGEGFIKGDSEEYFNFLNNHLAYVFIGKGQTEARYIGKTVYDAVVARTPVVVYKKCDSKMITFSNSEFYFENEQELKVIYDKLQNEETR
jgi:hypothetical protein